MWSDSGGFDLKSHPSILSICLRLITSADSIAQLWPNKMFNVFFITMALIRLCGAQADLGLSWSKSGRHHAQIQRGPTQDPNTMYYLKRASIAFRIDDGSTLFRES